LFAAMGAAGFEMVVMVSIFGYVFPGLRAVLRPLACKLQGVSGSDLLDAEKSLPAVVWCFVFHIAPSFLSSSRTFARVASKTSRVVGCQS